MQAIDFIVLIGIIALLIVIGLTAKSSSETTEDFFLAGRKLRWPQIGLSLFATNFSASAIVGITGAAYQFGVAIYNYEWVGIVAIVIFALFLVGVIRKTKVYTIAEYLNRRYDSRVKTIYSFLIIFLLVFVDMAASLYAGGLLLSQFLPGVPLQILIFMVMVLATVYSIVGGLKAISRTDMFQSCIIILGALFISYYAFAKVGGWSGITSTGPDEFLSLIRPLDDKAVPWFGIFTGITVLGAYFWLTNQNLVQWVLSAKDETEARRGLLLAGALKLIVIFVIVLPGIAALAFIPGLQDPDMVYPALMVDLLPAGVLGLVLAGFFAALMSNTESTIHAASTILTMDFVKPKYPNLTPKQLVWVGRSFILIILIFSALWAPLIGDFGYLFEYIQRLLSYAVAPFVVVYLGGMFLPNVNARGALLALLTGVMASIAVGLLQIFGIVSFHYLYVPLPVALISLIVLCVASRGSSIEKPEEVLLWSRSAVLEVTKLEWIFSGLILLAVAAQLIMFW